MNKTLKWVLAKQNNGVEDYDGSSSVQTERMRSISAEMLNAVHICPQVTEGKSSP